MYTHIYWNKLWTVKQDGSSKKSWTLKISAILRSSHKHVDRVFKLMLRQPRSNYGIINSDTNTMANCDHKGEIIQKPLPLPHEHLLLPFHFRHINIYADRTRLVNNVSTITMMLSCLGAVERIIIFW